MTPSKLHNYFSGNCLEEDILSIKEWAEASEENKKVFQQERVMYDILLLYEHGHETYNIKTGKHPQGRRKLLWTLAKVACVVATVLLGAYISRNITYQSMVNSVQTINVPAGQYIKMKLPDGTNVWLNAQTSIKYNSVFNHEKRHVTLDGEAYFQVRRNENLPFEVETSKGTVRVLGTEFNVYAYSESDKFETALINGEVEISLKDNSEKVILKSNTLASLYNNQLKVMPIENYNLYTWKDGILTFSDVSFDAMMNEFEKTFGSEIVIDNQDVQKLKYTGKFRVVDGLDYALRVLQKNIAFEIERKASNSGVIYIKSKKKNDSVLRSGQTHEKM